MSRFLLTMCLGSCLMSGRPTAMHGQERDNSTQDSSAQYDARALRVETHPGQWLLVRGRDGALVGKLGALRGGIDLETVVAPSTNAVREAREFKQSYHRGGLALGVGIAAFGIGTGVSRIDDIDSAVSTSASIASVAGIILIVYGGTRLNQAYTALARSIWWYNRDLAR